MWSFRSSWLAMLAKRGAYAMSEAIGALSRFMPNHQPSVLFEVFNPIGFAAQEPVIQTLALRGLGRVHVSCGNKAGLTEDNLRALALAGVPVHPLEWSRHRRFDAVIITDRRQIRIWRSSRYVYLHHGSGFGNRFIPYAAQMLEAGQATHLLAMHPAESSAIHARLGPRTEGRVKAVGLPKLDRMVNTDHTSRSALAALGLDPARKTILLMSHWTPQSLMHTWGEEILGLLRDRTECNILVTAHPHLWDPARSGGIDWSRRLGWIGDFDHMRLLLRPADLFSLMAAADVVITDHTSATLEYALLYRPIVLFRHPDFVFSDDGFDERLQQTSIVFARIEDFAPALEIACRGETVDRESRRLLIDTCFAHLGESQLHAAMAIEQIARGEDITDPPAR